MHGQGNFFDPRLDNARQFPLAASERLGHIHHRVDLITPKLGALHAYQLSLAPPRPPKGSFNPAAAARGRILFDGQARCSSCHVPPLFTEPGWNLHKPSDIGIDAFQANRSPTHAYRTAPLRGLFSHSKGGFYHDGRFASLMAVVNHYNSFLKLGLTNRQKWDLVQYLKSL
jgi:cytochrome c peroxidase